MTSNAPNAIMARLTLDKTGDAAAFRLHLPTKQRFQMAAQLRAELRHLRLNLDAEPEHAESAIPPSPTTTESDSPLKPSVVNSA